jgi:hypothetical protein
MDNTTTIKKRKDDTAATTAEICRVSDNYVRKIARGDRENEIVFTIYMEITERKVKMIEEVTELKNKLVEQASQLVPLSK